MTAFLTSLIERATFSAAILERRQRSLFEPADDVVPSIPRWPGFGGERADSLEQQAQIPPPSGTAALRLLGEPPLTRPTAPPRAGPLASPADPVGAHRLPEMTAPPPRSAAEPAPASPPPSHRAGRISVAAEANTAEPAEPRRVRPPETEPRTAPQRFAEPPEPSRRAGPARPWQPVAEPSSTPLPARPDWRSARLLALGSPPTGPASLERPVVRAGISNPPPTPAPAALLARARVAAAVRAVPPALPPMQITIGRIEVRADRAPAEDRRPVRPTTPRLSLDDYLNRRREAAR